MGGHIGADVPLAAAVGIPITVGVEFEGHRERVEGVSFTELDEVVLTYRLLRIVPTDWSKEKDLTLSDYRSSNRERMLGDNGGGRRTRGRGMSRSGMQVFRMLSLSPKRRRRRWNVTMARSV